MAMLLKREALLYTIFRVFSMAHVPCASMAHEEENWSSVSEVSFGEIGDLPPDGLIDLTRFYGCVWRNCS